MALRLQCLRLETVNDEGHRVRVGLRVGVLLLFLWMIRSLLVPVILGGVFAILLFPLEHRLSRVPRIGRFSTFIITASALILGVVPLTLVTTRAVLSINSFIQQLDVSDVGAIQSSLVREISELAQRVGIPMGRIRDTVTEVIQTAGGGIAAFLQKILSSIPNAIIDVFLFILSLYFFLRDGERFKRLLESLFPFPATETRTLFRSIVGTVRGAILGIVAVAFVQGGLTIAAFTILSVPGAVLFGLIAGFFSIIPLVGTTPVTLGAVIYLLVVERYAAAIGMGVAVVLIGASDNLVRPFVQSLEGRMHALMALLGIFGGLAVMGPAGIFIGPVVSALAIWATKNLGSLREV